MGGGAPGSGRLGGAAGPRRGPDTQVLPVEQEAIDGGSRVQYSNKTVLTYNHAPDAHFLPGDMPPADPREDFAEAFQSFMTSPAALLKSAPEKFLFLNAESRQYSPADVQRMAKEAGVDLTQVVTSLVVSGRASQTMIDRMCEFHGISADKVALLAKDQELLGKGANLDALTERLALDIGANGAATTKLLKAGEGLAKEYHGLMARLPLAREGDGLGKGNGVVSWLVARATNAVGGDRLAKVDAAMADVRAQFTKLPLAVQLRTDPRLALGATWFTLSGQERALLSTPEGVQQLIARAAGRAEDVAYIPQNLTANEKAQLANRTILEALFDPSSEGATFRAKLAGVADPNGPKPAAVSPEQALKGLTAKNGEKVWNLLSDAQKKFFSDPRNVSELKQMLTDPEAEAARGVLRDGSTGAVQLKASLLRFQFGEARLATDLKVQLEAVLSNIKVTRQQLFDGLGGSPLEVALTEVNRQVQEGNMPFIQKFLAAKGEKAVADVLGPWVANALSPAERKLLEDGDYRRHLVQDAGQIRSTGTSLADEARQYRIQTENIQKALDFLLEPDNQFRQDFERDPVEALKKRGLWVHLPDPIQQQLADGDRKIKLSKLVEGVQEAMSPIILRQIGYQKKLANLKASIQGVNAGNYQPLLGLLDLGVPEMQRVVKSGITSAMAGESEHKVGGPLTFV